MLQSLREKTQGWPAKVIFVILIFVFSFFGIESYFQSHTDTYVAKVGKHEISQQDFQSRLNNLRRQLSQQQGDKYDPSYLEKPAVKQRVLDGLVDQALLQQATDKLGLVVSTAQLRSEIANYQAFQVDGKFSPDAYRAVLASQGMSPQQFQDEVRGDLQTQLLPGAISQSQIITDAEIDQYLKLRLQTRDVRYAVLARPQPADDKVSDKAVADYYKAHQKQFMTPEQVSLNYIELNAADMPAGKAPSDDDLRKLYVENKAKYVQPEQREVSHILIKVPSNATPAQQKAALAKAKKIDAEVTPANFAKLAKQYSDDLGSKSEGGSLGWIEKGVTNKAFEDTLFSMDKGQISKPVLSAEGYHIIYLQDVRAGKAKPFAQVKDQLAQQAQKDARDKAYNDLASKLTDGIYQDPSSLEPIAKQLDLKIQHTGLFSRDGAKSGIAANPKVVKVAFSDSVLAQSNTSDPVSLGDKHIVVVHVNQHQASKPKPLDQVADQIRQDIISDRVDAQAKKHADALLAKLDKGADLDKVVADAKSVQDVKGAKRGQQGVPAPVLQQAFTMPHPAKGKSRYALADLGHGKYALVAVDAVHAGDLSQVSKPERTMLRAQMQRAIGTEATQEFIDALRKRTDVKEVPSRM
ncbi:SurA N-terminal domain-containing protein [Oleiagrimonas sp. C23AA]|uniref:SurA N-terminal domain-containing protein n=1 Tax=Oleiagrimonas sp. C23AA TaxID=2719047 RepID=UPI00142414C4|nr:SurA N-terminal domain-containing protein [Oleiagrimonas sp. C23AA]NII10287.1 peptidylprolyl isomerase [Oleiagrimonas sp. C23AA]